MTAHGARRTCINTHETAQRARARTPTHDARARSSRQPAGCMRASAAAAFPCSPTASPTAAEPPRKRRPRETPGPTQNKIAPRPPGKRAPCTHQTRAKRVPAPALHHCTHRVHARERGRRLFVLRHRLAKRLALCRVVPEVEVHVREFAGEALGAAVPFEYDARTLEHFERHLHVVGVLVSVAAVCVLVSALAAGALSALAGAGRGGRGRAAGAGRGGGRPVAVVAGVVGVAAGAAGRGGVAAARGALHLVPQDVRAGLRAWM